MQADWRLTLLNDNLKNKEDMLLSLKTLYSSEQWNDILVPIASNIYEGLLNGKMPDDIMSHVLKLKQPAMDIFMRIIRGINQEEGLDWNSPEIRFVSELLGRKLAAISDLDLSVWERVAGRLEHLWTLYSAWINSLPIEAIAQFEKELMIFPDCSHPLELIDTWGHLRDRKYWPGYDDHFKENQRYISDPWLYVTNLHSVHNEIFLSGVLQLRNDLLKRLDWNKWVLWIAQLPLIEFQEAALRDIRNLEEAQQLIGKVLHLSDIDANRVAVSVVLIIKHNLDLWRQINEILNSIVNPRNSYWDYKIDKNKITEELNNWQEQELPNRIRQVVSDLELSNSSIGKTVALSMLRHEYVGDRKREIGTTQLREAIIKRISEDSSPILIEQFMSEVSTKEALYSSIMLLFEVTDRENIIDQKQILEKIIEAYEILLKDDSYFWSGKVDYNSDESQLMWLLAGAVSMLPDPCMSFNEMFEKIYVPYGGWKFDSEVFRRSSYKVSHCLTVYAMATEWMIQNKQKDKAEQLYQVVWRWVHRLARESCDDNREDINIILIQLYARLVLVNPTHYTTMAINGIRHLDFLKHIIICLQLVLKNQKNQIQLPYVLQKELDRKYKDLFPAIRRYNRITSADIEWYTKVYELLTPNVKLADDLKDKLNGSSITKL